MGAPSIELIPLDRALIGLLLDNAVSVYPGCAVRPDDRPVVRDVAQQTKDFYEKMRIDPDWGGFLVADRRTRLVIGTCAYKGAPEVDSASGGSRVEIAYFTFPSHQGQGYATAMASALVDRAASSRRVETIVAHTLPEKNASGRVLEKTGFQRIAEVNDPEDGTIWRWQKPL